MPHSLPGFEHRYHSADGVRTHYVIGGSGPALVLVHGWPYTWRIWQPAMPLLAQAGYTVIAPDLRGLGESLVPHDGVSYDKVTVAGDIRRVAAAEGFERVNLVGMDIGAMVVFAYAITHPAEVSRLVLSESVIPGFGLEQVMNPATGGFWHFGFHMQVELAAMLTEGNEQAYLSPMWHMASAAGAITEAERSEWLASYTRPGAMRAGFAHYGTLLQDGEHNRANAGTGLVPPLLVLNGSAGLPQQLLAGGLAALAPGLQTAIIDSAGHAYAMDNPRQTAATLRSFFVG
jgi:pimeloyl-ACP methyl ester carboxylesterase